MRNSTLTRTALTLLAAGFATLLAVSAGTAQSSTLSWTETSTIEVPGTLGMILRAMPGALDTQTQQQALHLDGGMLVQDDGHHAVMIDMDNRRFVSVDHDARTYTTLTFEESARAATELRALMTEAAAGADQELEETRAEREAALAELRESLAEAREALRFRISADRTGRTRGFGGAGQAEQHIITAELEAAHPPEGVDDAEAGTLVFVMELWQSPDLPTPDVFYQKWGAGAAADSELQAVARDLAGSAEALSAVTAEALATWDPRMAAGLTEIADAVQHFEGTTVHSVVTVALLPEGRALDRDQLLAWQPESMGDKLRQEAGNAAREAAAGAARSALRGLSSRFGRGGDKAEEAREEETADVRPLFRVTTTKHDIVYGDTGGDPIGELRQRIEGYREVTVDAPVEGAGVR